MVSYEDIDKHERKIEREREREREKEKRVEDCDKRERGKNDKNYID